jgi:F-type H+-transporting ATPase subunit gamma
MAATKEIKRRIKSIKNTKKITKAMELVSAAKMRRAIAKTLASRAYAESARDILKIIYQNPSLVSSPLIVERGAGKTLVIAIGSDRGLCGVYNSQLAKKVVEHVKRDGELSFITIGKKAEASVRRISGNIEASFNGLADNISLKDILPVAKVALNLFLEGGYASVAVAYTDFKSALTQTPKIVRLLPLDFKNLEEVAELAEQIPTASTDFVVEPSADALLDFMANKLMRMALYQMMLESKASEESARMLAMKNASDAAGEMIGSLTLVYNKARQAAITQEISEISAGSAAVE